MPGREEVAEIRRGGERHTGPTVPYSSPTPIVYIHSIINKPPCGITVLVFYCTHFTQFTVYICSTLCVLSGSLLNKLNVRRQ
jgi:hypothetical protein